MLQNAAGHWPGVARHHVPASPSSSAATCCTTFSPTSSTATSRTLCFAPHDLSVYLKTPQQLAEALQSDEELEESGRQMQSLAAQLLAARAQLDSLEAFKAQVARKAQEEAASTHTQGNLQPLQLFGQTQGQQWGLARHQQGLPTPLSPLHGWDTGSDWQLPASQGVAAAQLVQQAEAAAAPSEAYAAAEEHLAAAAGCLRQAVAELAFVGLTGTSMSTLHTHPLMYSPYGAGSSRVSQPSGHAHSRQHGSMYRSYRHTSLATEVLQESAAQQAAQFVQQAARQVETALAVLPTLRGLQPGVMGSLAGGLFLDLFLSTGDFVTEAAVADRVRSALARAREIIGQLEACQRRCSQSRAAAAGRAAVLQQCANAGSLEATH